LLRKSTQSIGVGKLLKVMYNDKLHVKVDYFTPNETADNANANGIEAIITQLLTLLNNAAAPGPVHGSGPVIQIPQNIFHRVSPATDDQMGMTGHQTPAV
jgi:hypothetical protein